MIYGIQFSILLFALLIMIVPRWRKELFTDPSDMWVMIAIAVLIVGIAFHIFNSDSETRTKYIDSGWHAAENEVPATANPYTNDQYAEWWLHGWIEYKKQMGH